jgi:2-polyprenyl-3-methyl-5-hydroxy-6-metoxy-1,4-benzoquinol methylase
MNRKQRRATLKHGSRIAAHPSDADASQIDKSFVDAVRLESAGKLNDAVRAYKRVLLLNPEHAEACNNLGRTLQALGKMTDASVFYARALTLRPQLMLQYAGVCGTLVSLLPALDQAARQQAAAWPTRLTETHLFGGSGLDAIAGDPLLLTLLQSIPVRDVAFEQLLTSLRASLLSDAGKSVSDTVLGFACTLARQCFINEYVFATTADEDAQVERLNHELEHALARGASVGAMQLAVFAMYRPLQTLSSASALLEQKWQSAIKDLLNQQLREPAQEQRLRDLIPRLTAIEDEVSQKVRQQYEENPYPRWVHVARQVTPVHIDQYLRDQFPTTAFAPLGKVDALDMLIAGCGTGQVAIASVQKYVGAQGLAIDLSLSSLCYARRKSPPELSSRIEYAQADILKLASIGRSFDVIDACGVLHHMADPFEGWRILMTLLRPGGLMHLAFYSNAGRSDVAAAHAFIAERGFGSTPDEIRRCRQELLKTPLASVTRFTDFFTTSECRDLLFHVHEARVTIPAIKTFIRENGLKFIGFEFDQPILQRYRAEFSALGWSLTDLDRWQELETKYPDTFSGMYQFWLQKA